MWDDTGICSAASFLSTFLGDAGFELKEYFVMKREMLKTQKAQVLCLQ